MPEDLTVSTEMQNTSHLQCGGAYPALNRYPERNVPQSHS